MAAKKLLILCGLLAASCLAVSAQKAAAWVPGVATFSGEDTKATSVPNGACGFGELTAAQAPGLNVAGVSLSKSILSKYTSKGCSACLEIRCTDKEACSNFKTTTVVQVVDDCDECENSQVNLQAGPFSKLASLDVGRVAIEYRKVPCAFTGGVITRVDSYRASGGGWVRLVFKNVNGSPVEKVELAKAGTDSFRPLRNAFGAAWEGSRLPELPWDLRLTNADGKTLVLANAVTSDKTGDVPATKNF